MGSDLETLSAGLNYDPVMHLLFVVIPFVVIFGLLFWAIAGKQGITVFELYEQQVSCVRQWWDSLREPHDPNRPRLGPPE